MFLFRLPKREERSLFFITTLFLWLLLLAPYVYAWLNTPINHYCTFLIGYPDTEVCDQNFYIAWGSAQAANGHTLFEDKLNGYTTQRLVFNSWWLVTGKICGWLRMDVYLFNQVQRFVVIPVLCLVLFNFTSLFFADKKYRFMAFWLMIFSGYNLGPYPEANMFESMLWEVILPVAHVFVLVTVYFCYRVFAENGSILKAGVASFIMSTVYPYATVSVCFLMLAGFLFLVVTKKIILQKAILQYAVLLLFTIPMVLYDYYIVSTDPRYIQGIANFTSKPIWTFVFAFGLLFLLALWGVVLSIRKKTLSFIFLVCWFICILIQIYFPVSIIPFQVQLVLGIQVPMSLLAVFAFKEITSSFKITQLQLYVLFTVMFLSVSATNGYMYSRIVKIISKQVMPIYLENEIVEAMQWLKANADEEDVVISTPIISSYIPVMSNCRVYSSDYFAPTPDFEKKEKDIIRVFENKFETASALDNFLYPNHIAYVFRNNYSQRKNHTLTYQLQLFSSAVNVFENKRVQIYKTKLP